MTEITVDPEALATLRGAHADFADRARDLEKRAGSGDLDPSFGLLLGIVKPYYDDAKATTRATFAMIAAAEDATVDRLIDYESAVAEYENDVIDKLDTIARRVDTIEVPVFDLVRPQPEYRHGDHDYAPRPDYRVQGGGAGTPELNAYPPPGTPAPDLETAAEAAADEALDETELTDPEATDGVVGPEATDGALDSEAADGNTATVPEAAGDALDPTAEQPPLSQEELAQVREFLAEREAYLARIQEEADEHFWQDMAAHDVLGRSAEELRAAYDDREAIYFEDLAEHGDLNLGAALAPAPRQAPPNTITLS